MLFIFYWFNKWFSYSGSLCAVSDLSITTRTISCDVGFTYELDRFGEITSAKVSHYPQGALFFFCTTDPVFYSYCFYACFISSGTTVSCSNLFKNLPVRKQMLSNAKKKRESLRHVEQLVTAFAIIRPDVRFSLRHEKEILWQVRHAEVRRKVRFIVYINIFRCRKAERRTRDRC